MSFCQICDRPTPSALTSDGICDRCWRDHAADLAASDDPGDHAAAAWARSHADAASGPLALPPRGGERLEAAVRLLGGLLLLASCGATGAPPAPQLPPPQETAMQARLKTLEDSVKKLEAKLTIFEGSLPKKQPGWCLHPDSDGVCWAHSSLGPAPKDKEWTAKCQKYVGAPTCRIAGHWLQTPSMGAGSINRFELEQVAPDESAAK